MSTEDGGRSGRPKEVVTEKKIKKIHKMILNIIHEYLGMRKLCAKMIKHNKPEFLRRHVTMDESWLHNLIPKFNRLSSEWTAYDELAQKRGKTQQWLAKL
ncbi:hypothetical protein GWI33_022871 [Rhynchophorus ferrugineus]|uniref:Uncharacterized protein n=1 Tax=Rhynchophorus ferrugineus TaxID=354439 RepID=A0A834IPJ1_RHYFE|nr:hypothetical protein GWI33_022871 [Rhynchophorus ferrugineus]